jgi:hypothetical protein
VVVNAVDFSHVPMSLLGKLCFWFICCAEFRAALMELIRRATSRTRLKFLYDSLDIELFSGEEVITILDASQPLAVLWFALSMRSQLKEDNWRRHRIFADLSANTSPLAKVLRADDLQTLLDQNLSDLNQRVATFLFETYDLLTNPIFGLL